MDNISSSQMLKERWRAIPGFPRYLVSNFGRIKRLAYTDAIVRSDLSTVVSRHYSEIIVKTSMKNNSMEVNLIRDKQQYSRSVALLVAKAFLPGDGNCVLHKDLDNTNNKVSNLSWGKQCKRERRKK